MKVTIRELKIIIESLLTETRKPQQTPKKGDLIIYGDDFADRYYEEEIVGIENGEALVPGMDDGIEFSLLTWDDEHNAWVDQVAQEMLHDEKEIDSSLSALDNKILKFLTNASTSTTRIEDIKDWQIRPLKRGIRFTEEVVNIEGIMTADEIKSGTGLSVQKLADWMFSHGAQKMKRQRRRRFPSIYD